MSPPPLLHVVPLPEARKIPKTSCATQWCNEEESQTTLLACWQTQGITSATISQCSHFRAAVGEQCCRPDDPASPGNNRQRMTQISSQYYTVVTSSLLHVLLYMG